MATTLVEVLTQIRDELGEEPLAGGLIYTYSAGTTTPLATYQDLDGEVANTNPIELDSSGMAVIRLTDGVAYKFEYTEPNDNLLWTRDNITVGVSADASDSDVLVTLNYSGTPGAQALMGGAIFDRAVTFPIDFEGADGVVLTSPGSTYTISIRKNGVEVGTAAINTSGAYTFTTTGGTTVAYTAGDYLSFIAPDSGTAADFIANLTGALA
jgi:hypothetical protein